MVIQIQQILKGKNRGETERVREAKWERIFSWQLDNDENMQFPYTNNVCGKLMNNRKLFSLNFGAPSTADRPPPRYERKARGVSWMKKQSAMKMLIRCNNFTCSRNDINHLLFMWTNTARLEQTFARTSGIVCMNGAQLSAQMEFYSWEFTTKIAPDLPHLLNEMNLDYFIFVCFRWCNAGMPMLRVM